MTEQLTSDKLKHFIDIEDEEFYLDKLREKHGIDPDSSVFHTTIKRMVDARELKRIGRGVYRKIKKIEPVKWWENTGGEPINFLFPRSHEDYSEFNIEEALEVWAGDMILISGVSNYGKTTIACNMLGENLDLMPCFLMGSEYTAGDGKISPKFERRMKRMKWVEWLKDGMPRFQLYPVGSDYEDYIQPDSLNVVDWISLPGEYYMIDHVMKSIKDRVGNGIAVVVLQKNKNNENPEGGERAERYADVHIKIDPYTKSESMITLGKVKAPIGSATGRTWAFEIIDYGANLLNIREIVKCPTCYGKKWKGPSNNRTPCDACNRTGYINKK
jgi:hypothetical protein